MTERRGSRLLGTRKQHALRKLQKIMKNLRSAIHRSMAPLKHPYPLTLFAGTASEIAHYSAPGRGPLAVIYACQFEYVTFTLSLP